MAFAKPVFQEMIIKSSLILIFIHLLMIKGDGSCPENFVPCANQTDCIKIEQVCMANHQCVDSQGNGICHHCRDDAGDTISCLTKVKPKLIFECLSPNQICDGHRNCLNNDDEESCGTEKCASDSWPCGNGQCIKKDLLCNTRYDCTDGSDEGDFCHNHICGANKFRCRTGECILKSQVCDDIAHCPDIDDEEHCSRSGSMTIIDSCSIPSNTFMCSSTNSICIPIDRLCDGYQDCPKGDDEINCKETCSSESKYSTNINITCIRHPIGNQLYRCKHGYQLPTDPTKTCQDVNECNDFSGVYCSFGCVNTDGSYQCECPSVGYSIDQESKTCRKHTDQSKADFLVLYDDNISLYNLLNTTNDYSLKLFRRLALDKTHHFNQIHYDPLQMSLIYYDSIQRTIFCKSGVIDQTLLLISNLTMNTFAYNANDRTLFVLERLSQTLRMYTPITCEMPRDIHMHSWTLLNHFHPIQSMTIDFEHRQILFATKYEILVSMMSEPNRTKIVYFSDRDIKQITYDNTFKRIFWTTVNRTHPDVFLVHTCSNDFKKCYDTRVALQTPGPFVFFNDGLLYAGLSGKSLEFMQIYGKSRFSDRVVTSTEEKIHSFMLLNQQAVQQKNLCMENAALTRCKNQLCLQINSSEINCLSIDATITSNTLTPSKPINSNPADQGEASNADKTNSPVAKQRKPFFRRTSTKIILSMLSLCVIFGIIALVIKRYRLRLTQRLMHSNLQQPERYSTLNEPTLDEFTVTVDDRNYDRLPLTNQLHY